MLPAAKGARAARAGVEAVEINMVGVVVCKVMPVEQGDGSIARHLAKVRAMAAYLGGHKRQVFKILVLLCGF